MNHLLRFNIYASICDIEITLTALAINMNGMPSISAHKTQRTDRATRHLAISGSW